MHKKGVKIILLTICIVVCGVSGWCYWVVQYPAFHIKSTAYLYIDNDDSPDSVRTKIADILKPKRLIGFDLLSAFCGYWVNSGRYKVDVGDDMLSLFLHLRQGHQSPVRITIPTVRTKEQLAGILGDKLMVDSTTIIQALDDSSFIASWGYDTFTILALFVPDTYEVYWNVSINSFMKRMRQEHDAFWTEKRLEQAKAVKLSPIEVVTLASIIDEETAINDEKPIIAELYLNRLRIGMPLQADPTVKYALADFTLQRILHEHLTVESPYNTYINAGLPPGPIRIASKAGIDAVLNAENHPYLYMCAKEDFSGRHNFATNFSEHKRNAIRYSRALNRRGIR